MSKKAKTRLSEDEAREYSASLGKAATGNWELMDFAIHTLKVPESLDMDAGQWVESIGGYVRMSMEQRREAVRGLLADGKSNAEISRILGIGEWTVMRDKQVIEAAIASSQAAIEAGTPTIATPKLNASERKAKIREMIDAGKTDAEIAVALGGADPSGIKKHRKGYEQEKMKAELDARKANVPAPEMSDKEADSLIGDTSDKMKKALGDATYGETLSVALGDAANELHALMDLGTDITDFDECLSVWAEIGNELWVYGARKGLDVSSIVEALERMKGGDDA